MNGAKIVSVLSFFIREKEWNLRIGRPVTSLYGTQEPQTAGGDGRLRVLFMDSWQARRESPPDEISQQSI